MDTFLAKIVASAQGFFKASYVIGRLLFHGTIDECCTVIGPAIRNIPQ